MGEVGLGLGVGEDGGWGTAGGQSTSDCSRHRVFLRHLDGRRSWRSSSHRPALMRSYTIIPGGLWLVRQASQRSGRSNRGRAPQRDLRHASRLRYVGSEQFRRCRILAASLGARAAVICICRQRNTSIGWLTHATQCKILIHRGNIIEILRQQVEDIHPFSGLG
jgi:hypothetical protein